MDQYDRKNNSMHIPERRRDILSDGDIERIVDALYDRNVEHWSNCRFSDIDPEIMSEAMQFYKNFNSVFGGSGKYIWRSVLNIGILGILALIGWGIISRIKEAMGQ